MGRGVGVGGGTTLPGGGVQWRLYYGGVGQLSTGRGRWRTAEERSKVPVRVREQGVKPGVAHVDERGWVERGRLELVGDGRRDDRLV